VLVDVDKGNDEGVYDDVLGYGKIITIIFMEDIVISCLHLCHLESGEEGFSSIAALLHVGYGFFSSLFFM
jgi:hypothetical protein